MVLIVKKESNQSNKFELDSRHLEYERHNRIGGLLSLVPFEKRA